MTETFPFENLAFPDPRGSNRAAVESALTQAVERVADYLAGIASKDVSGKAGTFQESPPHNPQPFSELLDEVFRTIAPASIHMHHPGYMAHMDSGVAFAGMVGDFIASALNQNMLAQEMSPAATEVENMVVRWFAEAAGLPDSSGGTFVSGGTMANLTGLLAARDWAYPEASRRGLAGGPPLRLVTSAEAHFSIRKSAAVLGLGTDAVLPVPNGSDHRMTLKALKSVLAGEPAREGRVFAVATTAGATSTGAVDHLKEIGAYCRDKGIWFHVDASHGGALLFSDRERSRLDGIEQADSIALDPHKWLWAPKSAGIALLRRFQEFFPAHYEAPYLDREEITHDLGRKTIAGSRRFDALKVFMILRHLGTRQLGRLMETNIDLTHKLYHLIQEVPGWRCLAKPELNILCFGREDGQDVEEMAYKPLLKAGNFWISRTVVDGQKVLRTVILNPSTSEIELRKFARNLADLG